MAPRRPHSATLHGVTLDDPYAWLKDPNYPEVADPDILAYLKDENAYFEAAMAPHAALVDRLYEEMKGRIKEDDSSVPQKDGDWLYWTAFETGGQYRKWWRKPVAGGPDALLLDEPALAEGKEYFRLGAFAVSNDGTKLAYAIDDTGAERFTIRVKDLTTGEHLPDTIPVCCRTSCGQQTTRASSMAWRTRSGGPTTPGSTGWAPIPRTTWCCIRSRTRGSASRSRRRAAAHGS
jgi:oligopeptidase B